MEAGTPDLDAAVHRLLPGIHDRALSTAGAVERAREVIAERFPGLSGFAALFGSYSRNTQKRLSDVDVFVVDSSLERSKKCHLMVSGLPVELLAYKYDDFVKLIEREKITGRRELTGKLAGALFLAGDRAAFDRVLELAKFNEDLPARPIDPALSQLMRWRASDMMIRFAGADSRYDAIGIAARMLTALAFQILRVETGLSHERAEYTLIALKSANPEMHSILTNAFMNLVDGDDRAHFLSAVLSVLDHLGGVAWTGVEFDLSGSVMI